MDELKSAFPAFYEFLRREEMKDRKYREYVVYDVLPGATEEAIRQIEAELQIELPVSYKRFLRCTRGMTLFGDYVRFGIEHPFCPQIYHERQFVRSHTMLCFASCWWLADGDHVFFNLCPGLEEGEYPVMYYAHDDNPIIRRLGDSFEDWIERWLPENFGEDESETLLRAAAPSALAEADLLRAASSSHNLSSSKHLIRASETPAETRSNKRRFCRTQFKRG